MTINEIRRRVRTRARRRHLLRTVVRGVVLVLAVLILTARPSDASEIPANVIAVFELPNEPETVTGQIARALIGIGAQASCPGECLEVTRLGLSVWFGFNP